MKIEVNIHDSPSHIFSGYYIWYRVQAETKLILKSNHYTLHLPSQHLSFASKGKKKTKKETTTILSFGMDSVVTLPSPYLISEQNELEILHQHTGDDLNEHGHLQALSPQRSFQAWNGNCCNTGAGVALHIRAPQPAPGGCDCCTVLSFSLSVPDQHFPHLLHAFPPSARSANPGACAVLCL